MGFQLIIVKYRKTQWKQDWWKDHRLGRSVITNTIDKSHAFSGCDIDEKIISQWSGIYENHRFRGSGIDEKIKIQ